MAWYRRWAESVWFLPCFSPCLFSARNWIAVDGFCCVCSGVSDFMFVSEVVTPWEQQETCQDVSHPKKCLLLKLSGNTTSPTSRAQGAKQPDFKREHLSASQCSMLTSRQPSTPTSPLSCGSPSKRHYPTARAEKNSSPAVPDTKRRN